MPLTLTHLIDVIDGVDRTSYTIPSASFVAGRRYIISTVNSQGTAPPDVVGGITNSMFAGWTTTALSTLQFGPASSGLRRVSRFHGVATSSGTSTTVIAFTNMQTSFNGSIEEAQGFDAADFIVSNAVGTATDSVTSYSVARTNPSSVNAIFVAFAHNGGAATDLVLTSPLVQLYNNGGGTPASRLAVGWAIGAQNPACTSGATRQWGGTATVIRAEVVTGHPQFYNRRRQLQGAM